MAKLQTVSVMYNDISVTIRYITLSLRYSEAGQKEGGAGLPAPFFQHEICTAAG